MNPPLISVLFPVYNAGLFLEHALISIFFQTYQNFEIIAIDDCSTDNSLEILYKYQEKNNRIKIIKNERNLGLIDSLNIGLTHCSGDYIARMDPDDYIDKERFKKQIDFLTIHHDFDAVSSWMESFDEKGFLKIIKYRENIKDIKATLLFYSPVSHAASIFRASILKELAYRPEYKYAEDYDLWFRFLQKYKVGVIQEVLYYYRTHLNQSTNSNNNQVTSKSLLKIIENFLNYFNIDVNEDIINFHLNYCLNQSEIHDKFTFIRWNNHLRQFLFKEKFLIDDVAFIKYVFINYWQTPFFKFWPQLKFSERIKMLQSPFCMLSIFQKIKLFFK